MITEEDRFNGRRRKLWAVVVSLLLAIVAAGIILTIQLTGGGGESKVHQIGAILPLTGSLSYVGKMEGDGMRLAVEDINAAGGVNEVLIELVLDDSQGKPDVAVTATQKLMTVDGVEIIMASISSVVLGIKPVVARNDGILIGCCMHPDFFKSSPNVVRFYEGVEDEAAGFVNYLSSLAGQTPEPRIGILYVEVPNVREQIEDYIRPGLAEAGLDFVVMEPYRLSDKEFRSKVLKLRSANLTHLVILGYGFLYPNIFRELTEQKVLPGVQIIGGWGFLYPQLVEEDLEGVVVVGPEYVFRAGREIKEFYARFRERFGYDANFDAAMTYAAIQVLAEALRNANDVSDTTSIVMALSSISNLQTLIGETTVDDQGGMSFTVSVGVFRDGALVALPYGEADER